MIVERVVHSVLVQAVIYSTDNVEIRATTMCSVDMTQQNIERHGQKDTTYNTAPQHFLLFFPSYM